MANNKKLTKLVGFEELGGALAKQARKTAEEALTRTIVGFEASKDDFGKMFVRGGKAILCKAPSAFIDNEFLDVLTDVGAGYQALRGGANAYSGITKFTKAYKTASDQDVEKINWLSNDDEDEDTEDK